MGEGEGVAGSWGFMFDKERFYCFRKMFYKFFGPKIKEIIIVYFIDIFCLTKNLQQNKQLKILKTFSGKHLQPHLSSPSSAAISLLFSEDFIASPSPTTSSSAAFLTRRLFLTAT